LSLARTDRLPETPPASSPLEEVTRTPAVATSEDFIKRDRTARLLGVAYLLYQHPHGLTPPEIAERIGMTVRTVYRDLRALQDEVGIAVWQEGRRYGAEPTSFLPPLKLTLHEAVTLFLSARLMARYADKRDQQVVSAFNKLASILPSPLAQHVHATVAAMADRPRNDDYERLFDLLEPDTTAIELHRRAYQHHTLPFHMKPLSRRALAGTLVAL